MHRTAARRRRALCASFYCSLATAALLLPSGVAHATLIEFEMTGTVGRLIDPTDVLGGQYGLGTPFTGYASWDTSLLDTAPQANVGRYGEDPAGSLINLSMSIGDLEITTAPVSGGNGSSLLLTDNGNFFVTAFSPNTNGLPVTALELHLLSRLASTFSDDSLPTDLDLAEFTDTHTLAFLTGTGGNLAFVFGTIETLTKISEPPAVPEPTAALLFAIGLALAAGRMRRAR
jgi:hypothetical protein